jgi:hypothetical protein
MPEVEYSINGDMVVVGSSVLGSRKISWVKWEKVVSCERKSRMASS